MPETIFFKLGTTFFQKVTDLNHVNLFMHGVLSEVLQEFTPKSHRVRGEVTVAFVDQVRDRYVLNPGLGHAVLIEYSLVGCSQSNIAYR